MGIPQVMHEAMKSFAPIPANKSAATSAAVKAGELFLTQLQEPVDTKELESTALEVWNLHCRLALSKLLPEAVRLQLPPLYSQENEPDPLVVVKFFHPNSHWTWYAYEFDGLDTFFGWVYGDEAEPGYFTLSELEEFEDPLRIGIERDEHFTPMNLSEVKKLHLLSAPPAKPSLTIYPVESDEVDEEE